MPTSVILSFMLYAFPLGCMMQFDKENTENNLFIYKQFLKGKINKYVFFIFFLLALLYPQDTRKYSRIFLQLYSLQHNFVYRVCLKS